MQEEYDEYVSILVLMDSRIKILIIQPEGEN